jgi:hypothetical protein
MKLGVRSLGGTTSLLGGMGYHEGSPNATKAAFFSLSLPHKVGPQSLVVDLEVASKGSQVFPRSKSTTWKLPGDPSHLGFPTNQA